jgi:hypothetical protein
MAELELASIEGRHREDVRARQGDRLKDERRSAAITRRTGVTRYVRNYLILQCFMAVIMSARRADGDPFWRGRHRCFMRAGRGARGAEQP